MGGRDGRDGAATDHDANESDVSEALINKLDEAKQLQQQQQMTQFDVKIGAGMDIAIHGENGEWSPTPNCQVGRQLPS